MFLLLDYSPKEHELYCGNPGWLISKFCTAQNTLKKKKRKKEKGFKVMSLKRLASVNALPAFPRQPSFQHYDIYNLKRNLAYCYHSFLRLPIVLCG